MEATVIDFIFSTLMSLSAQYPDAAWLVTALSVVMTVCGLCAVVSMLVGVQMFRRTQDRFVLHI